jgi:hypothetical protein
VGRLHVGGTLSSVAGLDDAPAGECLTRDGDDLVVAIRPGANVGRRPAGLSATDDPLVRSRSARGGQSAIQGSRKHVLDYLE